MVFVRTGRILRSGRLVVFLILLSLPLFSQSDEPESPEEDSPITIEISPTKIIVGQRFDLTIFADLPSYRNVTIKEPQLPDGITLASGPYKSAQTINVGDLLNPQYIKKTRIFYKFKVSKPGIFTMGEFLLSDGVTVLETEAVLFPVLAFDERDLKYPIFAKWKETPGQIFVGETIPLILEMENLEELSFPERISMTPPAKGVFERVDSVGDIRVTKIGDDEVYIAPIDSWMYTPIAPGVVKIPKASVNFDKVKRTTEAFTINVVEVPLPVSASGAIGEFTIRTEMENPLEQNGSTSTFRIRVEGEGNLNYLKMPQPEFSGLTIVEKEELYNITPSLSGYSGYREDVYRVSIGEKEVLSIQIEPWVWYNKTSSSVQTESPAGYLYENNLAELSHEIISFREEFTLFSPDKILKFKDSIYDVSWYYLLLLPGFISVLAAFIRKRLDIKLFGYTMLVLFLTSSSVSDGPRFRDQLETAQAYIDSGQISNTLHLYDEIIDEFGDNPGIFYNQAIINYDLGYRDRVILLLRKSLLLKPGNRIFMNTLMAVENEYGLDHQATISTGFSPDLFFLLFILLFNAGAFIITFNMGRKKIELSILIVMVFFLSFTALSFVFYTDYVSERETAVIVSRGGDLKKVPGLMGASWLTLQEGTAVYIKSESETSYLITTGYGLDGWIDKKSLIVLRDID